MIVCVLVWEIGGGFCVYFLCDFCVFCVFSVCFPCDFLTSSLFLCVFSVCFLNLCVLCTCPQIVSS